MTDLEYSIAEITLRIRHSKVMICEGQGDPNSDGCGGQGGTGSSVCSCCLGAGLMTPQLQEVIVSSRSRRVVDDGSYYPSDLHGPDLLEWITGYYGANIPTGLGDKLYELAGEWRTVAERLENKTASLRVEIAAKQGAYNEIRIFEEENARLRRILLDGPTTPQECAEFCKCALEDGDGKPCIDCDPDRFVLP